MASRRAAVMIALLTAFLAVEAWPVRALERVSRVPRPDSPEARVNLRDGLLSVEAQGRPWAELVRQLRRRTGVRLRVRPEPEGTVAASFKDLPFEQALKRLFGPEASFVFLYEASASHPLPSPLPSEVWILGEGRAAPAALAPVSPPGETSEPLPTARDRATRDDPRELAVLREALWHAELMGAGVPSNSELGSSPELEDGEE